MITITKLTKTQHIKKYIKENFFNFSWVILFGMGGKFIEIGKRV